MRSWSGSNRFLIRESAIGGQPKSSSGTNRRWSGLSSLRAAAVADAYDSGETIRSLAEEFDGQPGSRPPDHSDRQAGAPPRRQDEGRRSRRRKGEKK